MDLWHVQVLTHNVHLKTETVQELRGPHLNGQGVAFFHDKTVITFGVFFFLYFCEFLFGRLV